MKKFQLIQGAIFVISILFNVARHNFDSQHVNHNYHNYSRNNQHNNQVNTVKNGKLNLSDVINSKIKQQNQKDEIEHKTSKVLIDAGDGSNKLDYHFDVTYDRYNDYGTKTKSTLDASGDTTKDYVLGSDQNNYKNDSKNSFVAASDFFDSLKVHMPYNYQGNNTLQFINGTVEQYAKILYAEGKINFFRIKATGILTCPSIELYANVGGKDLKLGDYGQYNFYHTNSKWSISLMNFSVIGGVFLLSMLGIGAYAIGSKLYSCISRGINSGAQDIEGITTICENPQLVNENPQSPTHSLDHGTTEDLSNDNKDDGDVKDSDTTLEATGAQHLSKPIPIDHETSNGEKLASPDLQATNSKLTVDCDNSIVSNVENDMSNDFSQDKITLTESDDKENAHFQIDDDSNIKNIKEDTITLDVPVIIEHDYLLGDNNDIENTINPVEDYKPEWRLLSTIPEENESSEEDESIVGEDSIYFQTYREYWREYSVREGLKPQTYTQTGYGDLFNKDDNLKKLEVFNDDEVKLPTYRMFIRTKPVTTDAQQAGKFDSVEPEITDEYDATLKLGQWKNTGALSKRVPPIITEEIQPIKSIESDFLDKKILYWKLEREKLQQSCIDMHIKIENNKIIQKQFMKEMNINLGINNDLTQETYQDIIEGMDDSSEFNSMITDYFLSIKNIDYMQSQLSKIETHIQFCNSFINQLENDNIYFKEKFIAFSLSFSKNEETQEMRNEVESICRKIDEQASRLDSDILRVKGMVDDINRRSEWFESISLNHQRQQQWLIQKSDRSLYMERMGVIQEDDTNLTKIQWLRLIRDYKNEMLFHKYTHAYLKSWQLMAKGFGEELRIVNEKASDYINEISQFEGDERINDMISETKTKLNYYKSLLNNKLRNNFINTYNTMASGKWMKELVTFNDRLKRIPVDISTYMGENADYMVADMLIECKQEMDGVLIRMDLLDNRIYDLLNVYTQNSDAIDKCIAECRDFLSTYDVK